MRPRSADAPRRHVVLAGGGHAHVHVLRSLAMRPVAGVRFTLMSPDPLSVYSGMVPGRLVGLYGEEEGWIDVAALAARAGATYLRDRMLSLDPKRGAIETEKHGTLSYDVLSLDVGSRPRGMDAVRGARIVVGAKPVEEAAPRIARFLDEARAGKIPARVVVAGGGAGGLEVAFALRKQLAGIAGATVAVVESAPELLPGGSPAMRRLVARLSSRYDIATHLGTRVASVDDSHVALESGEALEASLVVWATGAKGLPFLAASGLPVDERGFLRVDDRLRSIAADAILAAGDCAALEGHPKLPRAGVYAVRQGPVLERNVRALAAGEPGELTRYRPQRDALSLLSTGDGRAAVSYYGFASHGRFWWWLKDRIDRRFIARYAPPRTTSLRRASSVAANVPMAPCGGCAAKLAPDALASVLERLAIPTSESVAIGLAAPDDAAVLRVPGEGDLVFTIDAFPAPVDDLVAAGEIAAVNAVSDVYAMGGVPFAALALAGVRIADAKTREADLFQLLSGARRALSSLAVDLVGGHSVDAETPLIGFTVLGRVPPGRAITKGGARKGDLLVLTKPLGTGVVLAATRAGECPSTWTGIALDEMRRANDAAAAVFVEAGVRCCTDVSGFGLLGHLEEVLSASHVAADLWLGEIPALPGALELLACGWRSSADARLREALEATVEIPAGLEDDPRLALARDPQTSGGLLAAIAPEAWPKISAALVARGVRVARVGRVRAGPAGHMAVRERDGLVSEPGPELDRARGARSTAPGRA